VPGTSGIYWSASTIIGSPGVAWNEDFSFGTVGFTSKTLTDYVRAVRGGL